MRLVRSVTDLEQLYRRHGVCSSSIGARVAALVSCAAVIGLAAFAEARGDTSAERHTASTEAPERRTAVAAQTSRKPEAGGSKATAASTRRAAAGTKRTAAVTSRERRTTAPRSWRDYKKVGWRRGYVTLENPGNGRSWKGYVLGPGDTLLPKARQQVQAVLASWRTGRSRPIDPELIRLIAQVSDVFGGRPIQVISGYREQSHAKDSRHKRGKALDFSIEGVPNWALRDYLRRLRHTGIGFYPNSSFVHVDVRGYPAYWIDLSRPGAPPRYVAELPRSKSGG